MAEIVLQRGCASLSSSYHTDSPTDAEVPSPNSPVDRALPAAVNDGLAAGHAALARGDWEAAYQAFETVLRVEDRPDALEGLGLAAWWLDLGDLVFDVRERAYRERRAGSRLARMGHRRVPR
jgi:hypothetical protein